MTIPTVAPAAPNGAAANGVNGKTITETKPEGPKTAWDLKTDGPIKWKHKGQERALDSWEKVQQRLSFTDAVEEKARKEEERARKAEERASRIEKLKSSQDDNEAWRLLEEELGPDRAYKVAAARFRQLIQKDEEAKKLSPEARQLQQQLEQERAQRQKLENETKKQQQEREQQEFQVRTQQIQQYLDGVIGEALQDSGLKSESAGYFMPHVAALIARADELGLPVEPGAIAEEVFRVQTEMATNLISRLTPEAVVDMLEQVPFKEEGKPDSNYRKAMMIAWHQRSQKRPGVEGQTPEQKAAAPQAPTLRQPRTRQQSNTKVVDLVRSFLKTPPKFGK